MDRSVSKGEVLHQLIREATAAIKVGDVRSLKTLVDAWFSWDSQMRKLHRLDQIKSEPLVNIQLLAPLPDGPTYTDSEWFEVS